MMFRMLKHDSGIDTELKSIAIFRLNQENSDRQVVGIMIGKMT